jgi:hypothetical protein
MFAKRLALAAFLGLAACGGNPWAEDDGGNADTSSDAVYGSDLNSKLTMNSMAYDATSDQIVVNNIPFDGATADNGQAVYARAGSLGSSGFGRYENVAGAHQYYAVFRRSDSGAVQGGAVATAAYIDFGIGGAAVKRSGSVSLPSSGEYTFTGQYAAVRVYANSETSPNTVQYITGDSRIDLDFGDYDTTGAVIGTITNRQLYDNGGTLIGPMDDYIALYSTGFDPETGIITAATATGVSTSTTDTLTSGQWTGIIGGTNGTEIAGILVVEGDSGDSGGTATVEQVRETGVLIAIRPDTTP